mmetsp:Transcript_1559/g.4745  ORF Transcript_1559/g.4745 Transcript_1559/m.4745 type:complete len:192 (-) Transcript_1559:102-677(-)
MTPSLREHVDRFVSSFGSDGVMPSEVSRTRALRNHFTAAYAQILTWRALLNLGDSATAAKVSLSLRRTVKMIDLTLTSPELGPLCAMPADARTQTGRPKIVQDVCSIGVERALELATPLCQWAFDYDSALAASCAICRRRPRSPHRAASRSADRYSALPPFPTASLEEYQWPPLLPYDPDTNLFPFMNVLW